MALVQTLWYTFPVRVLIEAHHLLAHFDVLALEALASCRDENQGRSWKIHGFFSLGEYPMYFLYETCPLVYHGLLIMVYHGSTWTLLSGKHFIKVLYCRVCCRVLGPYRVSNFITLRGPGVHCPANKPFTE